MWAAAPVGSNLWVLQDRLKLSRSIEFMHQGFSPGEWLYMSRYISTVYVKCRNGSLKPALIAIGFSPGALGSDINLRV